jgi:hypothetical protein
MSTLNFIKGELHSCINIKFNKNGRFNYIYIPYFDIKFLREFITSLEPSSLYTVIPLLSFDGRDDKPHLILSKQILLTKYSSPELVNNYLKKLFDKIIIKFFQLKISTKVEL